MTKLSHIFLHCVQLNNLKSKGIWVFDSNFDEGAPVYSAANGHITFMSQESYGTIVIEHTSTVLVSGVSETFTWQTKYLHMNLSEGLIAEWIASNNRLQVKSGLLLGTVGRWGNNNPTEFPAHLHFSAHTSNGESINLDSWLNGKIAKQSIDYGYNTNVIWSNKYSAWVDMNDHDLIWDPYTRTFIRR